MPKITDLASSASRLASATAVLAKKQAELTRLHNVTLPRLYYSIGKHVVQLSELPPELGPQKSHIDELVAGLTTVPETSADAEPGGLAAKAKQVAQRASKATADAAKNLQLQAAYVACGKDAVARFGRQYVPESLQNELHDARQRIDVLNTEIAELNAANSTGLLSPRKLLLVGGGVLGLLVALFLLRSVGGMIFGRSRPAFDAQFVQDVMNSAEYKKIAKEASEEAASRTAEIKKSLSVVKHDLDARSTQIAEQSQSAPPAQLATTPEMQMSKTTAAPEGEESSSPPREEQVVDTATVKPRGVEALATADIPDRRGERSGESLEAEPSVQPPSGKMAQLLEERRKILEEARKTGGDDAVQLLEDEAAYAAVEDKVSAEERRSNEASDETRAEREQARDRLAYNRHAKKNNLPLAGPDAQVKVDVGHAAWEEEGELRIAEKDRTQSFSPEAVRLKELNVQIAGLEAEIAKATELARQEEERLRESQRNNTQPIWGDALDLRAALLPLGETNASFLRAFVEFGDMETYKKAVKGDRFEQEEANDSAAAHREQLLKQRFWIQTPVTWDDRPTPVERPGAGIRLKVPVFFRCYLESIQPDIFFATYDTNSYWYMTASGSLSLCIGGKEEADFRRSQNGIIYVPERVDGCDLLVWVDGDKEFLKSTARGADDLVANLCFEKFRIEEPLTLGMFKINAVEALWFDSASIMRAFHSGRNGPEGQPNYFVVEDNGRKMGDQKVRVPVATLKRVEIVKANTEKRDVVFQWEDKD